MKKMPGDITLLFIHVFQKWRSYDTWFLKCKVQQIEIFVIMGHFLPFQPPLTIQKIKILKLKKTPGDIIILHICTINGNHMMYGSWDMECDRQNVLSFGQIFALLPPYGPGKSKFWKNEKRKKKNKTKTPDNIIILHICTINDNHMYGSWDIERDRQIFLSFWTIFCPPPKSKDHVHLCLN